MQIYVQMKQITRRRQHIAPIPYELPGKPGTVRELIDMLVREEVRRYCIRLKEENGRPKSFEDMEDMAYIGKIAFGIPLNPGDIDEEKAVLTALQGFEDGLFRMFIDGREVTVPDSPAMLEEGSTLTLIRLTMLTGGYF